MEAALFEDLESAIAEMEPNIGVPTPRNGIVKSRKKRLANLETQRQAADLPLLHALIGHYARTLHDLQSTRIALNNRVKAVVRDGMAVQYAKDLEEQLAMVKTAEHRMDLLLTRLIREHPMRAFIESAPGIGLPGFGRLLGVTGPLDRFPNVAKLWKYLGLHVVEGHRPRMSKGMAASHTNCQGGHLRTCKPGCKTDHHPLCVPGGFGTAFTPQGAAVCNQLGKRIVMVGRGKYREAYDAKKAYYEAERDWTPLHRENAARRYAVKELLKDMWLEWRRQVQDDAHAAGCAPL